MQILRKHKTPVLVIVLLVASSNFSFSCLSKYSDPQLAPKSKPNYAVSNSQLFPRSPEVSVNTSKIPPRLIYGCPLTTAAPTPHG